MHRCIGIAKVQQIDGSANFFAFFLRTFALEQTSLTMDIDLFSEMIKELILDNDAVTLPGLGTFVTEVVPAAFSDRGYTLLPPYRKLMFRQRDGADSLLVDFYAKANKTDRETAEQVIGSFIRDVKAALERRKNVSLPGLGRLRATKENTYFFIPAEDLDIYPYGIGLEPVSLKTHEETPEEVSEAVAGLRSLIDTSAEEAAAAPQPTAAAPVEQPTQHTAAAPEEQTAARVASPAATLEAPEVPEALVKPEVPDKPEAPEAQDKTEMPEAQDKPKVPEKAEVPEAPVPSSPATAPRHPARRRHRHSSPWRKIGIATCALALAAALLLGVFLLLARLKPDFIDSLLYTPEELEILHYPL